MQRRSWMLTAAGAAALGAGVAWNLKRGGGGSSEDSPPALWTMSFDRPEGGTLAFASLRGRPLLLNFWATWCAPCIKEMPDLDRFHREQGAKGWQVVGLAIDSPTPVREFLKKLPVAFPIGLAGLDGTEIARQLGNTQGGLPFTVVFDAAGRIRERKLGQTQRADLERWAQTG